MRRPLLPGLVLGALLAVMPLAGHAAAAPSITLLSPSSGDITGGEVSIRWSYSGFYRTTPVDIEVRQGEGVFQHLARVAVDDGTPGYFGSATWSTGPDDDGTDYTVRLVMPTRLSVTSAVSPVSIDNTGPSSSVDAEPAAAGAPAASVLSDITGSATDAISEVASVAVTLVSSSGVETVASVTCGCDSTEADWSASTAGLAPGTYDVVAVATDARGNVGEPSSATLVIVGMPTLPDPGTYVDQAEELIGTLPDPGKTTGDLISTLPDPGKTTEDLLSTVTVPPVTVPPVTVPDPTTFVPSSE